MAVSPASWRLLPKCARVHLAIIPSEAGTTGSSAPVCENPHFLAHTQLNRLARVPIQGVQHKQGQTGGSTQARGQQKIPATRGSGR